MGTFIRQFVKVKDWLADKFVQAEVAYIRWRYRTQNRKEHAEQVKSARVYYRRERRYN